MAVTTRSRPKTGEVISGRVIARREYEKRSGGMVVLEIGAPRPVSGWDGVYPVRIVGLGRTLEHVEPVFTI
jgi:hypothetical protein